MVPTVGPCLQPVPSAFCLYVYSENTLLNGIWVNLAVTVTVAFDPATILVAFPILSSGALVAIIFELFALFTSHESEL